MSLFNYIALAIKMQSQILHLDLTLISRRWKFVHVEGVGWGGKGIGDKIYIDPLIVEHMVIIPQIFHTVTLLPCYIISM